MSMFERTERVLGPKALQALRRSRVIVFGIGGVGGHAIEALVRCGVGAIDIVDKDTVDESNLNRQIIATRDTLGRAKTEVMRERIASINPDCRVTAYQCFFLPETADGFDFSQYDYVVDAVDTVTAKLQIICQAKECGTPVISSMGTGNKLDPTALQVADISKTSVCPLAKVMRKELKKRGVGKVKTVFSKEQPISPQDENRQAEDGRLSPGSVSFVPSVAGLIIASEVVKDLVAIDAAGIVLE